MVKIDFVSCVRAENNLVFVWVVEIDSIFVLGPMMTWFCVGDRNGLGF